MFQGQDIHGVYLEVSRVVPHQILSLTMLEAQKEQFQLLLIMLPLDVQIIQQALKVLR